MLERNLDGENRLIASWEELGAGAPTLIALAHLCSRAMAEGTELTDGLSAEAKAILCAARQRGILEIRASNTAYESPARFLTVFVELDEERRLQFRTNHDPQQNIRFFDGFRQLCGGGLVMHHLFHEFSLTRAGFEFAATIDRREVQHLLDLGRPCEAGG